MLSPKERPVSRFSDSRPHSPFLDDHRRVHRGIYIYGGYILLFFAPTYRKGNLQGLSLSLSLSLPLSMPPPPSPPHPSFIHPRTSDFDTPILSSSPLLITDGGCHHHRYPSTLATPAGRARVCCPAPLQHQRLRGRHGHGLGLRCRPRRYRSSHVVPLINTTTTTIFLLLPTTRTITVTTGSTFRLVPPHFFFDRDDSEEH